MIKKHKNLIKNSDKKHKNKRKIKILKTACPKENNGQNIKSKRYYF